MHLCPQALDEAPTTARHRGHQGPLGDHPPSAQPPPAPPTHAPHTVPSRLSGPGSPGSPECRSRQGVPVRPARRDQGVSHAGAPCHGATAKSASLWRARVRNGVWEGTRRSQAEPPASLPPRPSARPPWGGGAGGARSSERPMQVGTAPPWRPLGLTASLRPWLLALQCGPCPALTPSAPAGPCDPTRSLGPLTPARSGRPHSVSKPLRPCPSQVPLPEGSTCPYSPQGAADHSSQQTFPGRPH